MGEWASGRNSFLVLLLAAAPSFSQVVLTDAKWQLLASPRVQRAAPKDIDTLLLPPGTQEPLGLSVTVRNEGKAPVMGVEIRYAVSARLVPVGDRGQEGIWSVPFWMEVERVPEIAAGKEQKIVIKNLHLDAHLRQLMREGYWLSALKLQLMTEPKRGEALAHKIVEAELPVAWDSK